MTINERYGKFTVKQLQAIVTELQSMLERLNANISTFFMTGCTASFVRDSKLADACEKMLYDAKVALTYKKRNAPCNDKCRLADVPEDIESILRNAMI